MPSHQARRKPLPKDYQFPTVAQAIVRDAKIPDVPEWWAEGLAARAQRVKAAIDDGDGYGHAV